MANFHGGEIAVDHNDPWSIRDGGVAVVRVHGSRKHQLESIRVMRSLGVRDGRRAVVAKLAKTHGAALVKYQHAFEEATKRAPADYWIWDGVHPTYRGHQIMADEWVKTVRDFWPQPTP